MTFKVLIDKSTKYVKAYGCCDFIVNPDTEQVVEKEFYFVPSLSSTIWEYIEAQNTFVTVEPRPHEEEVMEIILHKGKDRRLKIKGISFTALANETTNHDFAMPITAAIQFGKFFAGEAKTGDTISMIVGYGIPGVEYAYVDEAAVTKGADYKWGEEFGTSDDIPQGTPMRVVYVNTDDTDKIINFNLELRLPLEG